MDREPGSDLILFDDDDRRDFPGLPDWAPIEVVPGLFADIKDAQQEVVFEIQRINQRAIRGNYAKHQPALHEAHVRAIRLQRVASGFVKYAGTEISEAMLPVAI